MINFLKCSVQTELDYFFQVLTRACTPIRMVTKAAFTKARAKFRAHAFVELNQHLVDYFEANFPLRTWQGMRLLAMDGSTLLLPKTPAIMDRFDNMPEYSHHQRPLAYISQLYDVLNHITLSATIQPYHVDERDLAFSHTSSLRENDLVLLDRGYPAHWFFAWLRSESVHFFARLTANTWREAEAFIHSGQSERIVTLMPSKKALKKGRDYDLPIHSIQVRLIRISTPKGEDMAIATSLLDQKAFPLSTLTNLYHQRWGVEENFKRMKCRVELENFTGKTVHAIEQDFHARVFSMNLTAVLTHSVQDELDRNPKRKKYRYQVNFAHALACMRWTIVRIFHAKQCYSLCSELLTVLRASTEPVRTGREYPRKKVRRDHHVFHICYKPTG